MLSLAGFFLGSLFGSFFYTLTVRYLNGSLKNDIMHALFSFSKCPACGKRINPFYLIPIIGFLILRGKCRECGKNIPVIYLLMEVLYGSLAVFVIFKSGLNLYSINIFIILGLSISISVIDIRTKTIPNSFLIPIILFSIYPVILTGSIKDNLFGFLFMSAFFLIVLLIFPGSFGGGDVKYAAVIGALLGLQSSIIVLECALVTGSMAGVIYALKSGRGFRIKIPFAPFLTTGLFISLFYTREILAVYYGIFY